MAWSNQQPIPASVRRMRFWAWLLGYAVVLLLAVVLVSALLAGYSRQIPGSASVEPAYAAQGEVFDAALELALTPAVDFTGSFTSDAGDKVLLDARVSNEGSMLATLTLDGQDMEYLATGDRRFVRAGEQVWAALGEPAADAALYAGQWVQVDPDFLGVDLASVLAPLRLAWVIADPVGLQHTDAPGSVEQVKGVPARPVRAGELTVWISQDQPQRIVRIRAETPVGGQPSPGDSGDLLGRDPHTGDADDLVPNPDDPVSTGNPGHAGNLVPDPDDPGPTGDPGEDPGGGADPGGPPVEDPDADAGGAEELDIPDFEADLAAETVEQAQELLEQSMSDKVRELTESIDSRVSFSLDGEVVLAPCGPNGCTATVSLSNSVTSSSPYVTVNQPVNAEVTTTMTLDGAPVATCSAVLSMPPNGSASTQCSASYYVAPSQTPRTYVVRAEAVAIARALFQADIDAMLTDLANEQLSLNCSARTHAPRFQAPGSTRRPAGNSEASRLTKGASAPSG